MLRVYTAGYMAGEGSDRFDWRKVLVTATEDWCKEYEQTRQVCWLNPGVPKNTIPGQGDPDLYSTRDVIQVKTADLIVAYFDLSAARCLGTAHEVGMAYGRGTPFVMIDRSPTIGSLDFQRQCALSVVSGVQKAAEIIAFAAQGL